MRKILIVICLLAMLLLAGCAEKQAATEKGDLVFGSFVTTDMAGNPVTEEIFAGHSLTMVNIWATFCSPCIEEMPELAQLDTAFGEAFQVIGIVMDVTDRNGIIQPDKKAEAASVIATTGATYLHLLPSASLNKAYLNQVQAVPETIFVDAAGRQVGQRYIGKKSQQEWSKIISALLESTD